MLTRYSKLPHNRGHGFPKRLNPAGVLQLVHHKRTQAAKASSITNLVISSDSLEENLNSGGNQSFTGIPICKIYR